VELHDIIRTSQLFLFDLDGTLCCGGKLFPFTKDLLAEIKKQGKQYRFITNNSAKSCKDYVGWMAKRGIETTEDEFVTSGRVTIHFISENYPDAPLYICGTESLKSEFRDAGFSVTENLEEVGCVVVGYDQELNFQKIDDMCRLLYTKKIPYVATHPDKTCPTEYGYMPDCGTICDMIESATGKQPIFIGKPAPLMPELCMLTTGIDRNNTVVIGDKMETDIACGVRCGTHTILVLSGDNKLHDTHNHDFAPEAIADNCGEILKVLKDLSDS
jgi:HAD superfamily hydrolase (TIGR01450 family)